jgi:translation initiation factor 4G
LNKITPKSFDSLSDKLINVGIVSVAILNGIIKLVFDKALTQPKFCPMYADLCVKLSANSPIFEVDGKPQVRFFRGIH